jgi:hypothetical protein
MQCCTLAKSSWRSYLALISMCNLLILLFLFIHVGPLAYPLLFV